MKMCIRDRLGGSCQGIVSDKPGHSIVLRAQSGNLVTHIGGFVVGLNGNSGLLDIEYLGLVDIIALVGCAHRDNISAGGGG